MCSIFGIQSPALSADTISRHLDGFERSLRHRGPDGEGRHCVDGFGFGMTRLSIVDIEGGFQPFSSPDGRYHLICNGEIYNYRSLRKTLQHQGVSLRSQSDVEVILYLLILHGVEALSFLDGMFSFAFWDSHEKTLMLARDRFGIKPLFYWQSGDTFGFSSEFKALKNIPGFEPILDHISLNQYLAFDYVPAPRTILKNVYRVEPGSFLEVKGRSVTHASYWKPSFTQSESRCPIDPREYTTELRQRLIRSIQRESSSDVPAGIFLSGGLDSGAILGLRRQFDSGEIHTYSVGSDEKSFDESSYSSLLARHFSTQHHPIVVTRNECVNIAQSIGLLLDEPLADSSFIPTYILSKHAARTVKVALGGDGSDELFAGYFTYQAHKLVQLYETFLPFHIRARLVPKLINALPASLSYMSFDFKAKRFLSGRGVPFLVRHHKWMGAFNEKSIGPLWHTDLDMSSIDPYEPIKYVTADLDAQDRFNQALFCDMRLFLEGDILAKVDRASMAHGLEVRVPFLNREVAEFAINLPVNLKLRGFTTKYLLRKSLKGILPAEILSRKKKGFNVPIGHLLRSELKQYMLDTLSQKTVESDGLFNYAEIKEMIFAHVDGKGDFRKELWNLIVFQEWWRNYRGCA